MKNYELVLDRLETNISELASVLIKHCFYEDFDYDYDDNIYSTGILENYVCSDGEIFDYDCFDEALVHEIKWLLSESID